MSRLIGEDLGYKWYGLQAEATIKGSRKNQK